MSRLLIFLGIVFILLGFLWPWLKKTGLGHLPGDIIIKRGDSVFYFPLTTCIIISVIISIIIWLLHR